LWLRTASCRGSAYFSPRSTSLGVGIRVRPGTTAIGFGSLNFRSASRSLAAVAARGGFGCFCSYGSHLLSKAASLSVAGARGEAGTLRDCKSSQRCCPSVIALCSPKCLRRVLG